MATGRVPTTANSPLTAKGDLFGYSTTQARVAVGNDGETLVADSSTSTGLRYNPPAASLANPIINGGFDIWQRGTSLSYAASTSSLNYNTDRFQGGTGTNQACTISRQSVGDTTNLPNLQYCLRWQRNSGQTGTSGMAPSTSIETANSIPFAGKAITYSFYARAGANYSAVSGALGVTVATGTGTDQSVQSGLTGQTTIISGTATLTTTWQRFAFTGTVGATATQIAPYFLFTPTGTAGAADYFEATGLQIDIGTYTASTAPTFRRSGGTIQGELAACQRYYYRNTSVGNFGLMANGQAWSGTDAFLTFYPKTSMRTAPSSVEYASVGLGDGVSSTAAITSLTITSGTGTTNAVLLNATVASGLTQYRPYYCLANNSSSGYIGLSAEL